MTGSVSGFQTFGNALSDGDTTYYAIVDPANGTWEVGLGTWANSSSTLTRTTILESSSGSSAIDFSGSASKDVFVTEPASKSLIEGSSAISNAEFLKKNGNVIEGRSASEVLSDIGALSTSVASSTYLTQSSASSTYLTQSSASSTYAPLSSPTFTGAVNIGTTGSLSNNSGTFLIDANTNLNFRGGTQTFDNADGSTEYMRLTSTGLGVGTTANAPLAILSKSSSYEGLELVTPASDGSGEFHIGVHQSGSTAGRGLQFRRGGSDGMDTLSMAIDASGNVKIGSGTPAEKLDVGGTIQITTASGTHPAMRFQEGSNTRAYFGAGDWAVNGLNDDDFGIASSYTGDFAIATAFTNRFHITNTGYIGLGTDSPDRIFTIRNSNAVVEIDPAGASSNPIYFNYNRSTSAYLTPEYWALGHKFMYNGGSVALEINSTGNATFAGYIASAYMYDASNSAYYVDPASTSLVNILFTAGTLSVNTSSTLSSVGQLGIYASSSPYISFHNGTSSRTAYFQEAGSRFYAGEVSYSESEGSYRAPIFYDTNDTNYYCDPSSNSNVYRITAADRVTSANYMSAPIYYDYNNSAYYCDPASTSNLNDVTIWNTKFAYLRNWSGSYGNAGQVLTSNGSGGLADWADAGSGMMDLVSETKITTAATQEYLFTVAKDELHYFELIGLENTTNYSNQLYGYISSNGGSSYLTSANQNGYVQYQTRAWGNGLQQQTQNGYVHFNYMSLSGIGSNGIWNDHMFKIWYFQRTDDPPWFYWQNFGMDYQNPFHTHGGSTFYNEKTTNINKIKITANSTSFVTRGMVRHFKTAIT